MAKQNMTLRIEPELKAQAAALFKSLGLDLSTATGIFYRQALRCHGLPFEVKVDQTLQPMRRWMRQKKTRICMGRLIVLLI